jgi:uncharacterized iron-regulated protein
MPFLNLFKLTGLQSSNPFRRIDAITKTNNQEILKKLAVTDPVLEVRLAAIEKIQDEDFLAALANQTGHRSIASAVVARITSPDILFALATSGNNNEIIEQSAFKLAQIGDKRIIIYFDEIRHALNFRGSLGYSEFLNKIIELAINIPCDETISFLEKHYSRRDGSTAYQAQQSLRSILHKTQSTPLADRIKRIKDLNLIIKFNMY